ncbi:hypothetical protein M6D93_03350 [Jatrophihabitans telluris]|uniref:Protein kinase domain-containing protein n=1 Tax=Jatrophihabitans telluris TaxID=2038343 RepID=A0ABY4QZK2_9ACTN|nr:hypothetical protein [Jatrophihabitans telluris]UQX89044.1 hypothetical protein M6D93_03350 [Jatrophihabitans telluris]
MTARVETWTGVQVALPDLFAVDEPSAADTADADYSSPRPEMDTIIANRYRLIRPMSGTSTGFLAHDLTLGRQVQVAIASDPADPDAFDGHATSAASPNDWILQSPDRVGALAELNHPSLPKPLDAGLLQDGRTFVVTAYGSGHALVDVFTATSVAPSAAFLSTVTSVLSGLLAYLHERGYGHRGLTAESVRISTLVSSGTDIRVEVGLLGLYRTGESGAHGSRLAQQSAADDVAALGQVLLATFAGADRRARHRKGSGAGTSWPVAWRGALLEMTASDAAARPTAADVQRMFRLR